MTAQNEIAAITEAIMASVDCEKIYLFGSYAYGEPNADSDLDFYVVYPDESPLRPVEVAHAARQGNDRRKVDASIDIVASRSARFADLSVLPSMERKIVREGVLLYERGGLHQGMVRQSL
ncbi:MAG: nucleotidyltransferase domain-containing protein [Gracilibacteraceae bacterium]|jgi:predicted nucleotidyltransferase|nr:nucleotidyltransferase domain-containing protein [Gracilibacteraceae bacterium]